MAPVSAQAEAPQADAAADPQSYRVLVDSLFSSPTSFVMSNLVGVLVPSFCWFASGDEAFRWMAVGALLMALLRLSTIVRYRAASRRNIRAVELWRWDREYFLGATTFSLLLGAVTLVAVALTDNVPCHLMTVGSSIAFASGYVARNAGRLRFVIVQLVCFCAPTAVGLALAPDPFYKAIALYIVLFVLANIAIVFSLNRNLLHLAAATKQSARLTASLQRQNLTLDSALNSMTHGLCLFSADGVLEIFNTRFLELYGFRVADVPSGIDLASITHKLVRSQVLTPQSAADLQALCARAFDSSQPGEREILTESGRIYVLSVEITGDGGVLLLTEDASARKAAAAQIERMAHCDTLTGLPNRFRFNEFLNEALAGRGQGAGQKLALLYIDLDDFKAVNDTMGHEAGDQLLVEVAGRLRQLLTGDGRVARFGGDEFLLYSAVGGTPAALALGQAIISALAHPFDLDGKLVSVTTSVGVALGPEHGAEPSELLRSADMALYSAKSAGRNTAVVYTPAIADALSHRREMEADLREAVRTGRLLLHYQPIVDARTDQIRSYEALMRWDHPTKGLVSPGEFIPIAEQTGLIVQMGAWAVRQACTDAASWPEPISVAVNVSAFQFKNTGPLIEAVKDALLISGLRPTRLELEVTESLLIADQDATLEAIRTLRRLGVKFSLDDFGTGYSSLGYLARYPFSKVKIDRSFAEHLTSDSPSRSIIEVVCQLAGKLGMRVVVEGIETEGQRREIVALGAEQAQGWLFGRPKPAALLQHLQQDAA